MSKSNKIEDLIIKANIIHNFKYDYSQYVYTTCDDPSIIICSIHGEFQQTMYCHINRKQKCQKCSAIERGKNQRANAENIFKKANKVHHNKYNYSQYEYLGCDNKSAIICNIHGVFQQSMYCHINMKSGCPDCGHDRNANKQKSDPKEIFKKANKVHNNKYNYSKFEYVNCDTKSIIVCPKHGEFHQTMYVHVNMKCGCNDCGNELIAKKQRSNPDDVFKEANKIHKNKYDYSKFEYINTNTLGIIVCPAHGDFPQTMDNHLHNHGCPACGKIISYKEIYWLTMIGIPKEYHQKTIKINNRKFKVDAFEPKTNTIYEFHGDFWHGNPTLYSHCDMNIVCKKSFGELFSKTIERENILKSAGYKLITIWESDFDKLIKK